LVSLRPSYTAAEFDALFQSEGDQCERKTGLGNNPLQEALVAFSNADGGVMFIGVTDDGEVVGKRLDSGTEDAIHQAARDARGVGRYSIAQIDVAGIPVVAVQVERRHEGFAQTSNGRVLIRRGSSNTPLFDAELTSFLNERSLRPYESTTSGIQLSDVDASALTEIAEAFGWSDDGQQARLTERGLMGPDGALTVAGALMLTDARESIDLRKAVVDVRRIPEDDSLRYDRREEFTGPLHRQVRDATRFIVDEIGSDLVVTGLYRHELPRLPEVVVREAIANAVAHRSYELPAATVVELFPDRVVITSPGGLPEPVTVANIRQAQAARNPSVIDTLRRLRLAEDAGRGVDVMQDEMQQALLDPPVFDDQEHALRVVLPMRGSVTSAERAWIAEGELRGDLRAHDRLVVVHAARGEAVTNSSLRDLLGIQEYEARQTLQRLTDAGILERHGRRGGTHYTLKPGLAPASAYPTSLSDLGDILVAEAQKGPLSNERVRELTGLDRNQALKVLQELVAAGRLKKTGSKRGTRYHAA
jgi:ATP-dependent DNA helicase RecG